jgi:hypothetical protein
MAKRRNAATKIAVEEFIEQRTPVDTPSFDVGSWRTGEEKDRPVPVPSTNYNAESDAAAKEAEAALAEAERLAQLAREAEERAKIQVALDKSEADKAAAEAAAKAAQEAAAKAAAEAAAKAAADKAATDAAIKAAQDAANAAKTAAEKAAAEAALARAQAAANAAAAAAAAANNVNTSGNVFIPTAPSSGGQSAADLLAKQYAEAQAQKEKELQMQRQSIMDVLTDRFTRYNLQGLIPTIKRLAQEGATESTITFALQETEDYKRRFRGNEERMKKGLQVLSPAEYLNLEDGYRQILRSYGLNQFDTDDYVTQFIANDVSAAELSNRVVTAVQRVRNADPMIAQTLRDFYGVGDADLVAYVLDPNQQMPKIQTQVAAAEIGAAARTQGINAGVSVAEQLARQGITQAEAQRGYATIANILPEATKLSDIYGNVLEGYGLAEAEQEVFNSLASAQRKRRALTEREIAAFGGASGTGRTSLSSQMGGQF